jgi:hypothetical protein
MVDHRPMRLGKRPHRHDPRVPKLARYLTAQPPPPAAVDWFSRVPSWPMMKNEALGDCTCAAVGHIIQQWTTYAGAPRVLSDDDVVALYEAVGGYRPGDASTDQGAVELDVLTYWLTTGVAGDNLAAFVSLHLVDEPGGLDEVRNAIAWFGNAYIGVALPVSAQSQEIWDTPAEGLEGQGAPGSWGGHAVPLVGYDEQGLICVTWGALKRMTWRFYADYCDEAYGLLSRDFVSAQGTTPAGLSWDEISADMDALRAAA